MKERLSFIQECLLFVAFFCPASLLGRPISKCFRTNLQTTSGDTINLHLSSSDTIPLEHYNVIYAFSINATIEQPVDSSFVRIVLEDMNGHNYVVAESDRCRYDVTTFNLTEYCEETSLMNGITPKQLKCYVSNATLRLKSIHTYSNLRNGDDLSSSKLKSIRKEQVKDIVDRINKYNVTHNKLWRAGITELSMLSIDEKVNILGLDLETNTNNLEYYSCGIFEFMNSITHSNRITQSPYISSYDWCEKHGKNMLTPIRDQRSSPYCTAFAVSAGVEAMRNLYFNHLDMSHLSAQEIACCAIYNENPNERKNINVDSALIYVRDVGVMPDSIYPFDEYGPQTCLSSQKVPDDIYKISNYTYRDCSEVDTLLKKDLINNGPQVCWLYVMNNSSINRLNHAMLLVGYGQVHEGMEINIYEHFQPHEIITIAANDYRIGMTYLKFKNSWGLSEDNGYSNGIYDGYMYILFDDPTIIYKNYTIQAPITSELLCDADIICEDNDGDGFFNWGIGPKPAHCPMWAASESDGNDSDCTKGHMNQFGYCDVLPNSQPTYQYISNDTIIQIPQNRSMNLGILKGSTTTLTSSQTFLNGSKLLLDNGATLVLDGTSIEGGSLQPYPGSKIILNNGASILKPFLLQPGVELIINHGKIE